MKYLILSLLIFTGCEKVNTYDLPFVEMESDTIWMQGHKDMCERLPNSTFCVTDIGVGDIQPTRAYTLDLVRILDKNSDYQVTDKWYYNDTVHQYLIGDCEDEAMTLAEHMIGEGIDKKYLHLVYQLLSETEAHIFLAVDTEDGMMHVDINTGVAPIEERINYHMRLDDAGYNKWVKGNII